MRFMYHEVYVVIMLYPLGGFMVFRFIKLFLIVLLLLGSASTANSQVELPFDYFYGRWVDGYYFEGSLWFKDLEIDHLNGYNTSSFTNSLLQIKVVGLGNHILWDESKSLWDGSIQRQSPTININLRPSNKWQVGVNNFYIFNSSYSFNMNSIYMSDSTIKISASHAPYAYVYKKIISKGNYILENRFNYRKSSSYDTYFTNAFKYGLTDDINLSARVSANDIEGVSSFSPSYSFSILSGLLAPFYVEMSIGQNYFDSKFKSRFLTSLELNMTYISKGKFNQKVILADYQNYYKKMLFQNQFLLSVDIRTREIDTRNHENDDIWMQMKSAYGITSKINVESQINYSNYYNKTVSGYYERFNGYVEKTEIFSSERLSSQLSFSYFSHPYSSIPKNKWDADSKYDILFGSLLKSKELYMQFSFSPPTYSASSERKIDVLGLKDLKSNRNLNIDYYSLLGIGKGSEVGVNVYFRHHKDRLNSYLIELSARKRVFDKIYFNFELLKSFSKALGSTTILGGFNPYNITVQMKLAL